MDVTQFLDSFRLSPNRKIVIANLPESPLTWLLQLPRSNLLQHLHDQREFAALGFTEQKVNVLGHDDVSRDKTTIPAADTLQFPLKHLSRCDWVKQFLALITTEGDEVQASLILISDWFDVHACRLYAVGKAHPPAKTAGRMGQPNIGNSWGKDRVRFTLAIEKKLGRATPWGGKLARKPPASLCSWSTAGLRTAANPYAATSDNCRRLGRPFTRLKVMKCGKR